MGYLISQMWLCLLLAFLLGLLIGWLLGRNCCSKRVTTLEDEYKLKLSQAEEDRDRFRGKNDELSASLAEWQNNSGSVSASTAPAHFASMAAAETGMGWPYPVEEVEGIGPTYGQRLRSLDIENTADLLEKCCEASEQTETSKHVKVEPFVVGKWVSMCDLMRIPGIRGQFAELLEASGIASTGELARQEGATLAATLARVNAEEHRTPTVPDVDEVSRWVESAKGISTMIKSLAPK